MSHKQNDLYLEDLQEAEEEVKDSMKSWVDAQKERIDAVEWEAKMAHNYWSAKQHLIVLKDKQF